MDENLARFLGLPSEAEIAANRKLFDETLKQIFLSALNDNAGPPLLRAIVDNDSWFVAVKPDNSFDVMEVEPKEYRTAIEPATTAEQKKKPRGVGGRLLPLYAEQPEHPTRQLDGRALVRTLTEEIDGLLLHLPEKAPRELGREFFAELTDLADAFNLEEMLLSPGPGQVERLKSATWLVETKNGAPRTSTVLDDGRLLHVYTHRDRVGHSAEEITAMHGEQLFHILAEDERVDGAVVNWSSQLGRGENLLNDLAISPGIACGLLRGEDLRPSATPLPARSRTEVELWLTLRLFPPRQREWLDAPYPDVTLLRAVVPEDSQWRLQETLGDQIILEGPTWSPVFALPPGPLQENNREFGEGPTRILCAGLLARELNADSYLGKDPARYWRPGRNLLFGRLQDEFDRTRSLRRLAIARELAKLLPTGEDRIPRSALLTVEGAALMAEYPYAATRAWIEATVRQAERYTKRWVWNHGGSSRG
jgi:hypothetical protein